MKRVVGADASASAAEINGLIAVVAVEEEIETETKDLGGKDTNAFVRMADDERKINADLLLAVSI